MSIKIKFAIVGCGRIAERHAEHINNLGILSAICDIDPVRLDLFIQKYSDVSGYTNMDELLNKHNDIDVISICTPNSLHAEGAIKALRAGCHVLCEKPMAIRVEDCLQMIAEAEKKNKCLFIVKQNRFNPPIKAVKNAIDEGYLGRIFNVQLNCFWNRNSSYYQNSLWKGKKKLDGGTLYTQFSHFIDLLYWMVGDVSKVHAITANYIHQGIIEFEDTGVIVLEFYNGAVGTINYTVNSFEKNMEGSITIFGEKGTVKVGGQYLNKLEYQNIKDFKIIDLPLGNPANNYGEYQGSMSNHDQVYKNVIDVLKNQGTISTNGYEGLKCVEIIDKIYTCAENIKGNE